MILKLAFSIITLAFCIIFIFNKEMNLKELQLSMMNEYNRFSINNNQEKSNNNNNNNNKLNI